MLERNFSEVPTSGAGSPDLSRRSLLLAGTVLASMASLGAAAPATATVGVTADDGLLTTAQVRTRRLFFYNADTGRAAAGRLDNRGRYTNTSDQDGFSTGWTHVVAVDGKLFFYNADTGRAAAGRLDNRGRYTNTSDQSGFSTGWTHVVAVV